MLGPYVEKLYGSAKFVILWLVTGIAGVAASYLSVQPEMMDSAVGRFLFKPYDVPSAGASGALFGLVGVLFVFGIKFRKELPEGFKRAFGTGMLPMILVNLFIGYIGRGFIDNAAHMGGLVAGAVIALLVGYKRPGEQARVAVAWHVLQFVALALVVVSFVMVWLNFKGPVPKLENATAERVLTGGGASDFINFVERINEGGQAFVQAVNEGDKSKLDAAIIALDDAPQLDEQAVELRNELKTLLARAKNSAAKTSVPQRSPQERQQLLKLLTDFRSWQERSRDWFVSNSEKYGVKIEQQKQAAPQTPSEAN
jgi:hypothetical protein